jgi:hypothetical protein
MRNSLGKGKLVDIIAHDYDIVARFAGGGKLFLLDFFFFVCVCVCEECVLLFC